MKKYIIFIAAIICLFSCSNRTGNQNETATNHHSANDTISEAALWADESINSYLEGNLNRLSRVNGPTLVCYKESARRYGRNYAMAKIGYLTDDRFMPEQLVYIDSLTLKIYEYDSVNDSLILWKDIANINNNSSEILPDGQYRFEIAFAEWEGKSMGEKVIVDIKGNTIKVIYEGDGKLKSIKKGEIIDKGTLMKHKSGVWIIGHSPKDEFLDAVGGCTGGPAIIDLKNRKYWMC